MLTKATQTKTVTKKAEVKEKIELEVLGSMETDGTLNADTLVKNLTDNLKATATKDGSSENGFPVTVTLDGYTFEIDSEGNVEQKGPAVNYTEERVVENSNGTGTKVLANTKTEGEKLYIYFEASVEDGAVEKISPSVPYEVTKNGTYKFTITTKVKGETFTTTHAVKVNQYEAAIKVGDYVKYTSPTASVDLETKDTGYTEKQTLPRKDLFRVMEIKEDGSMLLVGAMTSSDKTIWFKGANGYNNAVYTLNEKCSELYKNDEKGITARSIKVEDITDKFNQTGKNKLTSYVSTEVGKLSKGDYITNVDTTNNKVTYKTYTKYPDIFQYEEGGVITTTENSEEVNKETTGEVKQSKSYSGYNGLTDKTFLGPVTKLTVPYTYYNVSPNASDFDSKYGDTSKLREMFFGTSTYYWLASRCINCNSSIAFFSLRNVNRSGFSAGDLCSSSGDDYYTNYRVCPVVSIPSSVQVELSARSNNPDKATGTPHEIK